MSTPRNHHFIPVFYLKQWCSPNTKKLVEYTIKHGKLIAKPVGPRATGYQTDLYSFPELPPEQAQHLEKVFMQYLDDTAARAMALHINPPKGRGAWTAELVTGWSRFLLSLHVRHPDVMVEIREALKTIWIKSGDASQRDYELTKKPEDPPTFDEYIAKVDPHIPFKAQVNSIARAIDNEFVINHFNSMWWTVVNVSRAPHRLLTSDRPFAMADLLKREGVLYLPISPTLLFFASNDEATAKRLPFVQAKDIIQQVNAITVARARRYVYAHDESQTRFIANRMSTQLEKTPLMPELAKYPPTPLPVPYTPTPTLHR
jgi:hypothetical protein